MYFLISGGSGLADNFGGGGVGRIEAFESKFRESDIDGRAEHRSGREKREAAKRAFELERDDDGVSRVWVDGGSCDGRGISEKLALEIDEDGVGGDFDLAAKACERVSAPLEEIDDARSESSGVER